MKNTEPRISANKLAQYITTPSPNRRNLILKNQKYPKGFVVTRYNDAKSTIVNYFVNGKGNRKMVEMKISELLKKHYTSPFRNQDTQLSIEALQVFRRCKLLDLTGFKATRNARRGDKLKVNGVIVSIAPDVTINGTFRGKEFVGAIKIHLSKGHPLDEASGKYVTTLLRSHLEEVHGSARVRPEFCILLDIFTGRYQTAPKSFRVLRKEIEAACKEIKLLWDLM